MKPFLFFLLAISSLAAFISFILFFATFFMDTYPESSPSSRIQKGNGVVTNIWVEKSKLEIFRVNNIRYLIVDVGDTSSLGELLTPREEIKRFVKLIKDYEKESDHDFILLAYSEVNSANIALKEPFLKNFVNTYSNLSLEGFDGVHVDIEPVPILDRNGNYPNILGTLRSSLPKNALISIYSANIGYENTEWEWTLDYFKNVSAFADIMVVPFYDTFLENEADYKAFMINQLDLLSKTNATSQIMIALPTHKQAPETLEFALKTYNEELDNSSRENFFGVIVFAEWTMDEDEWALAGKIE